MTIDRIIIEDKENKFVTQILPNRDGHLPIPRIGETISVPGQRGRVDYKVTNVKYGADYWEIDSPSDNMSLAFYGVFLDVKKVE